MFRLALIASLVLLSFASAAEPVAPPREVRFDSFGDRLPPGVLLRLGTDRFRHPGGVGRRQFSPDAKALLSVGFRGDAIVWDIETGLRLMEKNSLDPFRHTSPDGRFRAEYRMDQTEFEIRDTATDRILFTRKN